MPTYASQADMVARVGELQDYLGRQVLIENVSSYLQFAAAQMTEWEFLQTLAKYVEQPALAL